MGMECGVIDTYSIQKGGKMNSNELSREATKILRESGFTAGGKRKPFGKKQKQRKRAWQKQLERPPISTPMGGQPGYKIRRRSQ